MKYIVCWIHVMLSFCMPGFSQTTFFVTGKILDEKTRLPVPFVSVFLATTTIGQRTDEKGFFKLYNVPSGKYDLIMTSVGYHPLHTSIEIEANGDNLEFEMQPDIQVLKKVEVTTSRSEYLRLLKIFKENFIGTTRNADKCVIINIDKIDLVFDPEENILTASCAEPIEIENKALGYRIWYTLDQFVLDYNGKGQRILAGHPLFDSLKPRNKEEERKWKEARDRTYYGSLTHFMRCLKSGKLAANQFALYFWRPAFAVYEKINHQFAVTNYSAGYHRLDISNFRNMPYDSLLKLKIIYRGAKQEYNFDRKRFKDGLVQTTLFNYLKHGLVIYDNGYFDDPLNFYMDGYLAWKEKQMAELLPFDYQPLVTQKQRKLMEKLEAEDSGNTSQK